MVIYLLKKIMIRKSEKNNSLAANLLVVEAWESNKKIISKI